MNKDEITLELNRLLEGYIKDKGLDLIEFLCLRQGRGLLLRLLVDRPEGGITLGECADLNRGIGTMIDEKNILTESYILEVSSPGLDRPLKSIKDFARCINKVVRFFFNEPINGKWELEATVSKIEGDLVYIDIEGNALAVPLSKISTGKQKID